MRKTVRAACSNTLVTGRRQQEKMPVRVGQKIGSQKMERLTHKRVNGIKPGYWSNAKKDELIARLAEYEDTEKTPEEIKEFESIAKQMAEKVAELSRQLSEERKTHGE